MTIECHDFVVFGATGLQGSAVVDALLEKDNVTLRTITRNKNSDASRELVKRGVDVHEGSWDDAALLHIVLSGAAGVFVNTTPFLPDGSADVEFEYEVACGIFRACAEVGVPHVVFSSAQSADSSMPHMDVKRRIEDAITTFGLRATIIAPAMFMDHFSRCALFRPRLDERDGLTFVFGVPIRGDVRIPLVSLRDFGHVASAALVTGKWAGQHVSLTGCTAFTVPQLAAIFAKETSKRSCFARLTPASFGAHGERVGVPRALADAFSDMFAFYSRGFVETADGDEEFTSTTQQHTPHAMPTTTTVATPAHTSARGEGTPVEMLEDWRAFVRRTEWAL